MVNVSYFLGKQLFQESLKQGNLEAYFTLSEHLITQAEPSTCGPTSLSMIINALHIDPNRHWKGVWRWSSEYNLYCCPEDYLKNGLNFEQFANLSHCNRTKVQAFYYTEEDTDREIPIITKGENSGKVLHSKIEFQHEGVCMNKHGLLLKHGSYTTFLNNLVASSRRTGIYMIMNFSRPHLGQTGEGHFNPIAGIHLNGKKARALILDLAKFKYPGYWVDLEVLYEAMKEKDPSTNRSRGYVTISANKEANPAARGVSDDIRSIKEFKRHVQTIPKKIETYIKSYEVKNNTKPSEEEILYMILIHLGKDCNYLFTYYLYDLSIRLESKKEKELDLRSEFKELEKGKICSLIKSAMVMKVKNLSSHQIFWLTYDYQPDLMSNILTILVYTLERFITQAEGNKFEALFKEKSRVSESIKQEIVKMQRIFGLE